MKRVIPLFVLGIIIVLGFGTYIVDSQGSGAKWSFTINSGESVWNGVTLYAGRERSEWSVRKSGVTEEPTASYIKTYLNQRQDISDDIKSVQPVIRNTNSYILTKTKTEIFVLGYRNQSEVFLTKITRANGKKITKIFPINENSEKILNSQWIGVSYREGKLYLFYRVGEQGNGMATFNMSSDIIEHYNLPNDLGTIDDLIGAPWYTTERINEIAESNRYVPLTLTKSIFVEGTKEVASHIEMRDVEGLFAFDFQTEKIVKLADALNFPNTIHDHELRMLNEEGVEQIIDLQTKKIRERKTFKRNRGGSYYVGAYLYDFKESTDRYVIKVYDESGKIVSTAEFKAENREAKDILSKSESFLY